MQLKDYIEEGAKKAGSLTALGNMLGISQPNMSHAKAMKTALPAKAVVQLADYIGADLKAIIAANELVTEKDEAKRAFWFPFVENARAAGIALALAIVTNFVTPSPAEAGQTVSACGSNLYYVKRRKHTSWKKAELLRSVFVFFERLFKAPHSFMAAQIA